MHLLAATCSTDLFDDSHVVAAVRLPAAHMLPAALATEDPTPDLLEVPPNGKHDWIINGCMLKHIFWQVGTGLNRCQCGQGRWCHVVQASLPVFKQCQQAPPD